MAARLIGIIVEGGETFYAAARAPRTRTWIPNQPVERGEAASKAERGEGNRDKERTREKDDKTGETHGQERRGRFYTLSTGFVAVAIRV